MLRFIKWLKWMWRALGWFIRFARWLWRRIGKQAVARRLL